MFTRNTRYSLTVMALAALRVSAQGDPEALSGSTFNKPTKSWQQWQPKPTYALDDVPDQYMGANRIPGYSEPQTGFNRCAENAWNQKSQCQTAWINSIDDWCIWGPPDGGDIGSTERIAVAYCTTDKHGTRLIPDGTITGAHFLKTPTYVQISGLGDFTSIGIPQGDTGGEMDPHGADDLGNPIGGILFTTANPESNGEPWQAREWTNFMSYNQFCLRACWGNDAAKSCEHIYDVLGCAWNMPSERGYTADVFETCEGDVAPFAGVYGGTTFKQGDAVTPDAHPPAPTSNCQTTSSLAHGLYLVESASASSSSGSSNAGGMTTSTTQSRTGSTGMPNSDATSQNQGANSAISISAFASFATIAVFAAGAMLL